MAQKINKEEHLRRIDRLIQPWAATITRCPADYPYGFENALWMVQEIGKRFDRRFKIDDQNRFCYENLIRWCHADQAMQSLDPATGSKLPGNPYRGIYLSGPVGTGKTTALAVMRIYAQVNNLKIHVPSTSGNEPQAGAQSLWWNLYRVDDICDTYAEKGDLRPYKRMGILTMDDFGTEPRETLYMGNRVDVIRQIIEARGDSIGQLTLISSNIGLGMKQLTERYGDRAVSRIRGMTNYFEIRGNDRR